VYVTVQARLTEVSEQLEARLAIERRACREALARQAAQLDAKHATSSSLAVTRWRSIPRGPSGGPA
jgi:hypothetical protein